MKPTKPALWTLVKRKYRATSEGSKPGRWGPRKAALSQREYKRRGGGWKKTSAPSKEEFLAGKR